MLLFNHLFLSVQIHSSPLIYSRYVAINLDYFRGIFIQLYLELNDHGQVMWKMNKL